MFIYKFFKFSMDRSKNWYFLINVLILYKYLLVKKKILFFSKEKKRKMETIENKHISNFNLSKKPIFTYLYVTLCRKCHHSHIYIPFLFVFQIRKRFPFFILENENLYLLLDTFKLEKNKCYIKVYGKIFRLLNLCVDNNMKMCCRRIAF